MELATLLPQYLCDGGRYFVSKNWNKWEPLAKYQYSNVGIATVGLAIEQVWHSLSNIPCLAFPVCYAQPSLLCVLPPPSPLGVLVAL